MFNVNTAPLIQPAKNRGKTITKNDDGTASIDGVVFDRASDVDDYLGKLPRLDEGSHLSAARIAYYQNWPVSAIGSSLGEE